MIPDPEGYCSLHFLNGPDRPNFNICFKEELIARLAPDFSLSEIKEHTDIDAGAKRPNFPLRCICRCETYVPYSLENCLQACNRDKIGIMKSWQRAWMWI